MQISWDTTDWSVLKVFLLAEVPESSRLIRRSDHVDRCRLWLWAFHHSLFADVVIVSNVCGESSAWWWWWWWWCVAVLPALQPPDPHLQRMKLTVSPQREDTRDCSGETGWTVFLLVKFSSHAAERLEMKSCLCFCQIGVSDIAEDPHLHQRAVWVSPHVVTVGSDPQLDCLPCTAST